MALKFTPHKRSCPVKPDPEEGSGGCEQSGGEFALKSRLIAKKYSLLGSPVTTSYRYRLYIQVQGQSTLVLLPFAIDRY